MVIGLLRLVLAYAVVTSHSNRFIGFNYLDGSIAVWAFFVISGFFMALILDKKYDSYSLYITNRYLRLFPTYIVVFILSIIFSCIAYFYYDIAYSNVVIFFVNPYISIGSKIYVALVNIIIIGQNSLCFMGFDLETMSFYLNPEAQIPLNNFLFIEQAWTLSIEFLFYLIAPFLVKFSNKYLILIGVSSFILRIFMNLFGFTSNTWIYHFFPTLLFLFILGILSYRLYTQILSDKNILKLSLINKEIFISSNLVYGFSFFVILVTFLYNFIPNLFSLKPYLYVLLISAVLPFLFKLSSSSKHDKILGDLSYPVYIVHNFVVCSLLFIAIIFGYDMTYVTFSSQIVFTVVLFGISLLLIYLVERPVNKFRQSRIPKGNVVSPDGKTTKTNKQMKPKKK